MNVVVAVLAIMVLKPMRNAQRERTSPGMGAASLRRM
jgi:hypothetical protein